MTLSPISKPAMTTTDSLIIRVSSLYHSLQEQVDKERSKHAKITTRVGKKHLAILNKQVRDYKQAPGGIIEGNMKQAFLLPLQHYSAFTFRKLFVRNSCVDLQYMTCGISQLNCLRNYVTWNHMNLHMVTESTHDSIHTEDSFKWSLNAQGM